MANLNEKRLPPPSSANQQFNIKHLQQNQCIIPKDGNEICKNKFKQQDSQLVQENNIKLSKIDIIKKFDNKYKEDIEKMLKKDDEKLQDNNRIIDKMCTSVSSEKLLSNNDTYDNLIVNHDSIVESQCVEDHFSPTKNGHSNGTTPTTTPPKPLPRTSRNNSVSDQGNNITDDYDNKSGIRPVARPRTSATYKVVK